ncbi:SixA phosphatase family protein [Chelativorans salis]|uniref:Histidine phosphatase family protein n=1 Tax=Chelativorans salis TaxID=2978478 RepID=A0ABT2LLZ4_9HYPH|nr:histidine phosphatase family protein [Chelativorans sp. EGI FJ00035]MCT7374847.1 histidine phosphatase family protein [Chelativorans sp. EGI FJ00035]
MRELLLLRHAKSGWDNPTLDDFDRPLAARGEAAAALMGREVAVRGWVPDTALVSAALRTRQTWRLAAVEMGEGAPSATRDKALYMASADRLLALIRQAPEDCRRLLLLGHNPGMEDLAVGLAGPGSDAQALARMRAKFPTAALARFTVEGPWAGLGFAGAQLTHFLCPRDFAS